MSLTEGEGPDDGAVHGADLTPADHVLLRGRPPGHALRWAAGAVAPGARVTAVEALTGGTSSALHRLSVETPGGSPVEVVLRRFVRADWLAREPDLAEHEARVLELLAGTGLPVPRLVAVDPDGTACDVPALVMTVLDGHVDWHPTDLDAYLRRLAEPLPAVHAVTVPETVRPFSPHYRGWQLRPPSGTTQPAAWARVIEVHAGPVLVAGSSLVHRDYHPGNVLWRDRTVVGLVDWASASRGAPDADVGHCRWNLAERFGADVADRFLVAHRSVTGAADYDPYWDAVTVAGLLGEGNHRISARTDDFVARIAAAL